MALERPDIQGDTELDELDLTPYKCVYVSYGSKQHEDRFGQECPSFLGLLEDFYPLVCIAIDPSFTFTMEERNAPYSDDKKYMHITVPTKDIANTIRITDQIVRKLEQNTLKACFFVNFIKFKRPNPIEERILKEAGEIKAHIPYDYYEWGGFKYPNFIIKTAVNKKLCCGDVTDFLEERYEPSRYAAFITAMADSKTLQRYLAKLKNPDLYASIENCLIDITPSMTSSYLLNRFFPSGGTRKRKSKRRKSRKHVRY